MTQLQRYVTLAARTFLAIIFLRSGINKLLNFNSTMEFMASAGIPLTGLILGFSIIFLLFGGLSIILGYKARIGAVLLLMFLIPATVVFHNPIAAPEEMTNFMKNLSIIGGLLFVLAMGSGALSLENVFHTKAERSPTEQPLAGSSTNFPRQDRLKL